jgi:hypothetical protein
MCDYEYEQQLLRHLKVKNVPIKHQSETSGWEMAEHLHGCVLAALKGVTIIFGGGGLVTFWSNVLYEGSR